MKKIRIGNDIVIKATVTRLGEAEVLEGKTISLRLTNPLTTVELPFTRADNVLTAQWLGSEQKYTGKYSVTLVLDYGDGNRNTVDECAVFTLVSRSCEEEVLTGEQTIESTLNIPTSETETTDIDLSISVPSDGLSAYEVAVKNGYEGTEAEWLESLKEPAEAGATEAVAIANAAAESAKSTAQTAADECTATVDAAMTRLQKLEDMWDELEANGNVLFGDVATGKEEIAAALSKQGSATESTESLSAMAKKVEALHLYVEPTGFDGLMSRRWLFYEMYKHQRADYPYMVGAVVQNGDADLQGGDAYWCSDDYFTETDEVHTIADAVDDLPIVIAYYKEATHSLPSAGVFKNVVEMIVYGGQPQIDVSSSQYIGQFTLYTDTPYEILQLGFAASGCSSARFFGLKTLKIGANDDYSVTPYVFITDAEEFTGGRYISGNQSRMIYASIGNLKKVSGGYVAHGNSALTTLTLPALESMSGGIVARENGALKELSLPSLESMSGGTVAYRNGALTTLTLPALESMSDGTVANQNGALNTLTLPALESMSGGTVASATRSSKQYRCRN